MACEERAPLDRENKSHFVNILHINEICPRHDRPIMTHPDLEIFLWQKSYIAPFATDFIIEVWRESSWRSVLQSVFDIYSYEIIDQFLLGKIVKQISTRHTRRLIESMVIELDVEKVTWSPPLGVGVPADIGFGFEQKKLVNLYAVDTEIRRFLYSHEAEDLSADNYKNLRVNVEIREGDDLATLSNNFDVKFGLENTGSLFRILNEKNYGFGNVSSYLSRQSMSAAWLDDGTSFLLNSDSCNHEKPVSFITTIIAEDLSSPAPKYYCNHSLTMKVLHSSAIRKSDIASLKNGSRNENKEMERTYSTYDTDGGSEDHSISIAMTTCRRLSHFLAVAEQIVDMVTSFSSTYLMEVVVVDDGSSDSDRAAMLSANPAFSFIFKSEDNRGHANSLNIIMRHVSTRYVLYLEDDWKLLSDPFLSPPLKSVVMKSGNVNQNSSGQLDSKNLLQFLIRMSIRIIDDSISANSDVEPIAQVFLNDQVSRACAVGNLGWSTPNQCERELVGRGGWHREATVASIQPQDSFKIPYCLHEFGLSGEVF